MRAVKYILLAAVTIAICAYCDFTQAQTVTVAFLSVICHMLYDFGTQLLNDADKIIKEKMGD